MRVGDYDVDITFERLSVRIEIARGGINYNTVDSLYYIRGCFDDAPSLCAQTEDEFHARFYTDNGATHVRFGNWPILVIGMSLGLDNIKVFIDSTALVGVLLVTHSNHIYCSECLGRIIDIDKIRGDKSVTFI